jgi:hypothetical protein
MEKHQEQVKRTPVAMQPAIRDLPTPDAVVALRRALRFAYAEAVMAERMARTKSSQ